MRCPSPHRGAVRNSSRAPFLFAQITEMSDGCSGKPQFDSWFWSRDRLTDRLRSATPVMSEDTLLPFDLPSVARKKLSVGFDGGQLSSDAGVPVLRGVEKKRGLAARLAACIRDRRKPERVEHPLEEMLRLRMFAIAAGYEDADDCDSLRYDPIFKMAVGHAPKSGDPLCSQPTMSRLENAPSKIEIGRAPCRERVYIPVVAVSLKNTNYCGRVCLHA